MWRRAVLLLLGLALAVLPTRATELECTVRLESGGIWTRGAAWSADDEAGPVQEPCQSDTVCLGGSTALGNATAYVHSVLLADDGAGLDLQSDGATVLLQEEGDLQCRDFFCQAERNVCQNGAECFSERHTTFCKCAPGWLGEYCEERNPCAPGQRPKDATAACVSVTVCDARTQVIAVEPTATSDRMCRARTGCPAGRSFVWQDVRENYFERSSDEACQACPDGTVQDQDNSLAECRVHALCPPGQRATARPNATADTACQPCPDNSYQPKENRELVCIPKSDEQCKHGQRKEHVDDPTRDLKCVACPPGEASNDDVTCAPSTTAASDSWFDKHNAKIGVALGICGLVGLWVAIRHAMNKYCGLHLPFLLCFCCCFKRKPTGSSSQPKEPPPHVRSVIVPMVGNPLYDTDRAARPAPTPVVVPRSQPQPNPRRPNPLYERNAQNTAQHLPGAAPSGYENAVDEFLPAELRLPALPGSVTDGYELGAPMTDGGYLEVSDGNFVSDLDLSDRRGDDHPYELIE